MATVWTFDHVVGTISAVGALFAAGAFYQAWRTRQEERGRWESDTRPAVTLRITGNWPNEVQFTNAGGAARPAAAVIRANGQFYGGTLDIAAHAMSIRATLLHIGPAPTESGRSAVVLLWARDGAGKWWDTQTGHLVVEPHPDAQPDGAWLYARVLANPPGGQ